MRAAMEQIAGRLLAGGRSLAEVIANRDLYFRVSVVGECNLSCAFCHNEGGPDRGLLDRTTIKAAVAAAGMIGYRRVQLTGGEPLIRPDIAQLVADARRHVDDVGVTTNGTFLGRALDALITAGITRIHISLQTEPLVAAGRNGAWGVPDWLSPTVRRADKGDFKLRLNLPVPADCLPEAEAFLALLADSQCDVKVFSVLPEGEAQGEHYPLKELDELVARVNAGRTREHVVSEVLLRGFRPPAGVRCPACPDLSRCKEQSHSLRLGVDGMLRPCLATRIWDVPLATDSGIEHSIREATLLALDY